MTSTLAERTVGVMGSGRDAHEPLARSVGQLLARLGVNLLTGAGGGVMAAVSRAYVEAPRTRGISIGIVPCLSEAERGRPKPGYPNAYVELPIYTHLALSGDSGTGAGSRNHINVLSSDAIVALPGRAGTASEVELALSYGRPVVAYATRIGDLDNLNPVVPRLAAIDELEAFLADCLRRM